MRIPSRVLKKALAAAYRKGVQRGREEAESRFDHVLERMRALKELNGTSELFAEQWGETRFLKRAPGSMPTTGKITATPQTAGQPKPWAGGAKKPPAPPQEPEMPEGFDEEVWQLAPDPSHVDSFRFLESGPKPAIEVAFKNGGTYRYDFPDSQRDNARVVWEEMSNANHPGIVIWEWLIRGGVPYKRLKAFMKAVEAKWGAALVKGFDESKHPRGQPENAGEFAPRDGGASGSTGEKESVGGEHDHAADYKANGTRSIAFKAWFGDWESDPGNASKVVNADGEPQETHGIPSTGSKVKGADGKPVAVYHGTARGGFEAFDKTKISPGNLYGPGFYFTEEKSVADEYQEKGRQYEIDRPLSTKDMSAAKRWFMLKDTQRAFREDIGTRETLREAAKAWEAGPEQFAEYLGKTPDYPGNRLREKLKIERRPVVGQTAETKAVYLNIRKPFDIDRELAEPEIEELRKAAVSMQETETDPSEIKLLDTFIKTVGRDSMFLDAMPRVLARLGYDGMTHIGGSVVGNGYRKHRVWIAFEPTQIKSVENEGTFDPNDARMHKSWDESRHPRDHGRFSSSPGSSGESGDNSGVHSRTPELSEHPADARARSFLSRLAAVPRAIRRRVGDYVAAKFARLSERYGESGAKAILAATVLMLPVPLPGVSMIPVALAEAVLQLRQAVGAAFGKAVATDLDDETVQREALALIAELYEHCGEEMPAVAHADVQKALEVHGEHGRFMSHAALVRAMLQFAHEAAEMGQDAGPGLEALAGLADEPEQLDAILHGAVRKGFDPNESRDESGKWTSGGGGSRQEQDYWHGTWVPHSGFRKERGTFYITADRGYAESYRREGGDLLHVRLKPDAKIFDTRDPEHLAVAKRLIADHPAMGYWGADDFISKKFKEGLPSWGASDLIDEVKKLGFDGMHISERSGGESVTSLAIFEPDAVIVRKHDGDEATEQKAFDESLHPRDRDGRFISKEALHAARHDPAKAAELRKQVSTKDRGKLDKILSGEVDPGHTKLSERHEAARQRRTSKEQSRQKAKDILNHIRLNKEVSADDVWELSEHLKHLTVAELRLERQAFGTSWLGAKVKKEMVARLVDHAWDTTGYERPKRLKERKPAGPMRTESLYSVVVSHGGIDPDDHALLAIVGDIQMFREEGLSLGLLKKGGNGLDALAQELMTTGDIIVPQNWTPAEYLFDQLKRKAYSAAADLDAHYNRIEDEYWRKQAELEAADVQRSEIDRAVSLGEAAGESEGATGPLESLHGEPGEAAEPEGDVDTSFDPADFGGDPTPPDEPDDVEAESSQTSAPNPIRDGSLVTEANLYGGEHGLKVGDVLRTENGEEWLVHSFRHGWVFAHPIENGKPQVHAGSGSTFYISNKGRAENEQEAQQLYHTGRNQYGYRDEPDKSEPASQSEQVKHPSLAPISETLPDKTLFRLSGDQFANLQKQLGIKKPKMGPDGARMVREALENRPGGKIIAAILAVDAESFTDEGLPKVGNDRHRSLIEGNHTAEELLDAAKWASASEDWNFNRFLYGTIKTAKTKDGTPANPEAFAHIQNAANIERIANSSGSKHGKDLMAEAKRASDRAHELIRRDEAPKPQPDQHTPASVAARLAADPDALASATGPEHLAVADLIRAALRGELSKEQGEAVMRALDAHHATLGGAKPDGLKEKYRRIGEELAKLGDEPGNKWTNPPAPSPGLPEPSNKWVNPLAPVPDLPPEGEPSNKWLNAPAPVPPLPATGEPEPAETPGQRAAREAREHTARLQSMTQEESDAKNQRIMDERKRQIAEMQARADREAKTPADRVAIVNNWKRQQEDVELSKPPEPEPQLAPTVDTLASHRPIPGHEDRFNPVHPEHGPHYSDTHVLVGGNTYPYKDAIKKLGGRWNAETRQWLVPIAARDQLPAGLHTVPHRLRNYTDDEIGALQQWEQRKEQRGIERMTDADLDQRIVQLNQQIAEYSGSNRESQRDFARVDGAELERLKRERERRQLERPGVMPSAAQVTKREKEDAELSKPVVSTATTVESPLKPTPDKTGVQDFGEVIGGARKHTAVARGSASSAARKEQTEPAAPAWKRHYKVRQDAKSGKWFITHGDQIVYSGGGRSDYNSQEEAERSIPLHAIARTHGVHNQGRQGEPPNFAIHRKIGERKRPVVKDGFASYEDAQRYMAQHPEEILNHKFPDWEAYSYLDSVQRTGPDHRKNDVDTSDFQKTFAFRGGQFGNWQLNKDGQTSLNHAYDALHDLARVTGLSPKDISLNGKLAIAFGARGTGGLHSAKAHYEPQQAVINLTKMKGAGSLGHEWFHALDHHVAKLEHGENSVDLLTSRRPYGEGKNKELVAAWKNLVNTIVAKNETAAIDPARAERFNQRAMSGIKSALDGIDQRLQSEQRYNKRFKPFTPEQQAEWDKNKARILSGDYGEKTHQVGGDRDFDSYKTHEAVAKLNELYKQATGRSLLKKDATSYGRQLQSAIDHKRVADEQVARAGAGQTETKQRRTDFFQNAIDLDKTRTGDYYSLNHEMAARAFQSYLEDKLAEQGHRSDYLSAKADNKYYRPFGALPFPEGEERATINAAFDRLFDALRTHHFKS